MCGSSIYRSRSITLDYFPTIDFASLGTSVEFYATGLGATSYQWFVPNGWLIDYGQNEQVLGVQTNGISGIVSLQVQTICGGTTSTSIYYESSSSYSLNSLNKVENIVYPNPAVSNITISNTSLKSLGTITITDEALNVCKTISTHKSVNTIDVSDLQSGIYILRIKNDRLEETKRLVVK